MHLEDYFKKTRHIHCEIHRTSVKHALILFFAICHYDEALFQRKHTLFLKTFSTLGEKEVTVNGNVFCVPDRTSRTRSHINATTHSLELEKEKKHW